MRTSESFSGDIVSSPLIDDALGRLAGMIRADGYAFSPVTPATHARVNARGKNAFASDMVGVFGWSRPFRSEAISADMMSVMRQANVLETDGAIHRSSVRFSSIGDLLFVHSAYPTTAADSVFFGPDTVRFVNLINRYFAACTQPVKRAVDIGCGAGPGGIVVARARPSVSVSNLDINETALRFARINASINGASNVETLRSDILRDVDGEFDLIVSNPPYLIDPGRRAYRHGGGNYGEGLSLDILKQAVPRLSATGALIMYTGSAIKNGRDEFKTACLEILEKWNIKFSYEELDPDVFGEELETDAYSDVDRIAIVALTVNAQDCHEHRTSVTETIPPWGR
jgi:SAM-dependent methyltransferase